MDLNTELWDVRLPSGRVLRGARTETVRHHIRKSRIPPGSQVRAVGDPEWLDARWVREFADLMQEYPPAAEVRRRSPARKKRPRDARLRPTKGSGEIVTAGARVDSARMRLIGVGRLLQELLSAVDATLTPKKLLVACLAGLVLGPLLGLLRFPLFSFGFNPPGWGWCLALAAVVVVAVLSGLLARFTYVELSRLRPARWEEGTQGLSALATRLFVANAVGLGILGGVIALLRWLPGQLLPTGSEADPPLQQGAAHAAIVAGMVLEVGLWPLGLLLLPLGSLLAVEGCSLGTGLRQWLGFVRTHFGRLLLYEGLATGVGLIVTVPFVLSVLVLTMVHPDPRLLVTAVFTRDVLIGFALTLLLAYLIVANVFIYLNLRYVSAAER
jgi:hypothetical protein